MVKERLKLILIYTLVFVLAFYYEGKEAKAKNVIMYTLGDNGQTVKVKSRVDTIDDYMEVEGYEVGSYEAYSYIDYREPAHHTLNVATDQGVTEGYCMQPYMKGPDTSDYNTYDYAKGMENTPMFSLVSDHEKYKTLTTFMIATKYAYGGTGANPNNPGGRDPHSGGTYGTYIINDSGNLRAVNGLMIGGKVYEMTADEARCLTQVIVHYVGNRGSERNITSAKGNTNPASTQAAFNHLKAYADSGRVQYDNIALMHQVCAVFDNNQVTLPHHNFKWQVFNYKADSWEDYTGGILNTDYVSSEGTVDLRVNYYSKNMCNKILSNSSSENISVNYNYSPFVLKGFSSSARYYDYFTVENPSNIPIKVTYNMITAGKEKITNSLLNNMQYDIDIFSQTANVEIKVEDLEKNNWEINLSVCSGSGASSTPCFNQATGNFSSIMYSSYSKQDFLYLSSNLAEISRADITMAIEMTGSISLNKVSGNEEITQSNPCYSFNGAVYNVYAVENGSDTDESNLVGTFNVDTEGNGIVTYSKFNSDDSGSVLSRLPMGWYLIMEEKAPDNGSYELSSERYYVNISNSNCGEVNIVTVMDKPVHDPIAFQVVKKSIEGENIGATSLEGAEFTVEYYKGEYNDLSEIHDSMVLADRKWVLTTKYSESGDVSGCVLHPDFLVEGSDPLYFDGMGNAILPLGTIVVRETKAPEGYELEGATYSIVDTLTNSEVMLEDCYISKVVVDSGNVKLQVGNTIIVEDEPIRGDLRLTKVDAFTGEPLSGIEFLVTSKTTGDTYTIVTDADGVADTSVSGVKGALPYDTYTVSEIQGEANKDYYLAEEFEICITKMNEIVDCGIVENVPKPQIRTEAFDKVDMDKIVENNTQVTVVDKVYYSGLVPGKIYVLKGEIVNKYTSETIKDKEDAVEASMEFSPEDYSGYVEMLFEFRLNCNDKEIVVYEALYDKETGEEIASHEDINSPEQTLSVRPTAVMAESEIRETQPKTGDATRPIWLYIMAVISVLGIFLIVLMKKKTS